MSGPGPASPIDPITLSVIWGSLQSITVEVGTTVHRTAHSQQAREGQDFSVCLFDPEGRHGRPGPVQPGAHGRHVVRRPERGGGVPGRPAPAGGRGAVQQPLPRVRPLSRLLHDPARVHRRWAADRLRRQHPPPHRRGRHAAGQPGRRGRVRLLPGGPPRPTGEALEGRRGAGGHPRHYPREHADGGVDAGRPPRPAELAARGRAPDDRARAPIRSRDGPGGDGRDHGPHRDEGAGGDPGDPERRRTRSRTTWTTRGRAPRRCASR